ncbi:MAG: 4'-phosphopantetheinyl transferase superfamily protein [Myxococcota bacterium]
MSQPISGVSFNLSHTEGLAAVAVASRGEVGCDVEHTGRRGRLDAIAKRFFTPGELATMEGLEGADRRGRFFEIWTLKEAYCKARGLGLHLPTTSYAVLPGGDGALRVEVTPAAADPTPELWRFYSAAWGPDHRLAVAVDGPLERVRTFAATADGGWSAA